MRLTTLEQFKDLIGVSIVAIPTGNNRNRRVKIQNLVKFGVVSVGRKYVKLARLGGDNKPIGRIDNYCPDSGSTQSAIKSGYSGNAGYIFFEKAEDVEEFRAINRMRMDIREHFQFSAFKMSDDDIKAIHKIASKYMVKK